MENHNVFAGAFVDRGGDLRKDADWLAEAVNRADSRFLPVWGEKILVGGAPPQALLLERALVEEFVDERELIFLGLFRNQPAFALAMFSDAAPFAELGEFQDLRYLGTVLPPDEANLVAHARALVLWHASQVFCGRCGTIARPGSGGNSRVCTNSDCEHVIFPRVDPAIIVLVAAGERCLLGRQASWPEGRYSTIAGFVEPGESLEDAVRREVFEETNIRVGKVSYHSSQPWPFPSSLMLGFVAEATSADIALNDGELEDARWFTRAELRGPGLPKLPFSISISRRLVDYWIDLGEPA
ncbi:MAG: NAD(+) diphosphatase [Gammaproteobacteria bacterium]|nr:NAD(+) diphosphatase [Gammaproteobacteria bacterium]